MVFTKAVGNLHDLEPSDKNIDWLELEWEDLNKKILRKRTQSGRDISIALEEGHHLHYGDILHEDENTVIAIRTKLEKVYVITPKTMREMGKIAYEIGNRHTECIIEDHEILVRYDHTLVKLMDEVGVTYEESERRFKEAFKYRGHQH